MHDQCTKLKQFNGLKTLRHAHKIQLPEYNADIPGYPGGTKYDNKVNSQNNIY